MSRNCSIALIESDPLIQQLTARWLSDAGHRVVLTSVLELRPDMDLDLIVVNIANPRVANQLMSSLGDAHAAPVLLVSARFRRSRQPSPALAHQLGAAAVLPKPYTRDELLAAVEAAGDRC